MNKSVAMDAEYRTELILISARVSTRMPSSQATLLLPMEMTSCQNIIASWYHDPDRGRKGGVSLAQGEHRPGQWREGGAILQSETPGLALATAQTTENLNLLLAQLLFSVKNYSKIYNFWKNLSKKNIHYLIQTTSENLLLLYQTLQ